MSRTKPRDALNPDLSSSSNLTNSSDESEESWDDDDVEIERILSEVKGIDVLDALPPTPKRSTTRSQSRCSVSSAVSSILSTPQRKGRQHQAFRDVKKTPSEFNITPIEGSSKSDRNSAAKKDKTRKEKRSEKDILKGLGIDLEDEELQEIKGDEDDRIPMDNIIEDLLSLGMGKKNVPGGVKNSTMEDEKLDQQRQKLSKKVPLEINGDGRLAVLMQDVTTVSQNLEKVNALISVLENARDKLINEDQNLVFTQPPLNTKKKSVRVVPEKKST